MASSPRGFGDLLAAELRSFGAADVRERALGVEFTGSLEVAYRACLESRVGSRVFLVVAQFTAADRRELLRSGARHRLAQRTSIPSRTLACDFSGKHPEITHTRFGALRLKDAICDQLRDTTGSRPDIATERPAVRVHAHANGPNVTVSIDLSGEGLHRRGYRAQAGEAPLRENLAAGILLRAGWPEKCKNAAEFLDPMCGSGTLVIEAAMIAANVAPGARRHYFGFFGWVGHDRAVWENVKQRCAGARAASPTLRLRGVDADRRGAAGGARQRRARRPGRARSIRAAAGSPMRSPRARASGFLATNPPYGVRLEDRDTARALMKQLGGVLRENFRRLGRGDSRGFSGCGPRTRHPRRACAHGVERRARVPPAAPARIGRNGKADAAHRAAARASTSRWPNRRARRCSATASPRTSSSSRAGRSAKA